VVETHERRDVEQQATSLGVTVLALDAMESVLPKDGGDIAAIVASQGHYDEEALETILRRHVPYVGLVASRKRGATVRSLLEQRGVHNVAAIQNPAGLDLGARMPAEVALSILAEIVKMRPTGAPMEAPATPTPGAAISAPARAVDPVCGMDVD